MVRRLRNWIKLVKYINKYRRAGVSSFRVIATRNEFILYPDTLTEEKSIRMTQQFDYADVSDNEIK